MTDDGEQFHLFSHVFTEAFVSSQVEKDISEIYLKLHQSFEDESNFLVSMQDTEKLLVSMDLYQNLPQG